MEFLFSVKRMTFLNQGQYYKEVKEYTERQDRIGFMER